jgi:hypothetical protein
LNNLEDNNTETTWIAPVLNIETWENTESLGGFFSMPVS